MGSVILLTSAAFVIFAASDPADANAAETVPAQSTSRTTVYTAQFFTQFAPRTAYDIVQRVPGFTLDLGATQTNQGTVDVRGFAGTAGNVVINGARPSTKAETLDVTLGRIPAQQVVRVEVGPGDLFGSDYAGKSQVLNIILSQESGIDGNATAAAKRWFTGYVNTDVQGSTEIRHGATTINLSGGTGRNRQLEEGSDKLTDPVTGQLLEFRRKHNSYFNKDPFLAASWALERGSDDAFRFNARWQPSSFDLFQRNRVTTTGEVPHDDNLIQTYRDPVLELGGDITRPLAGGALKFVVLETRRKRHDVDQYIQRDGLISTTSRINGGSQQVVKARRNETIGRLSWTRSNLMGVSFEAGAETAFNTLNDHVALVAIGDNGDRIPIPLPIARATVKEARGEVYVNIGKTFSSSLRLDGGVNYESSSLTVRGDATADRNLSFFKPNLALDWKWGGGWHAQFSVRRTVAQLDFYDFISSGDLSAKRLNVSNAQLQPQRTWEFRASADHKLLGDGLMKLDLGHDLISMLQDRILVFDQQGNAFDSPGNLGTGRRFFATLTVDAPLDRIWKGVRAKFNGTIQKTRVIDPISNRPRRFSGYFPDWQWELNVRRDSGSWSYGFDFTDNQRFTFYRTDEFDTNLNIGAYMTAFAEYRPSPSTAIRFDVDNALSTHAARDRLIFVPNRAFPSFAVRELRDRNRHASFQITLKQSFGGKKASA